MKLYLAGPLFTTAERTFNELLAVYLEQMGHEVWLPQATEPRESTAKAIFEKDVEGLDWCDAVVACMDGPDPDSGTCWECGYAYARKIPFLAYRTDFRGAGDGGLAPFNLMLSESAAVVLIVPALEHDDQAAVFFAIRKALETIEEAR